MAFKVNAETLKQTTKCEKDHKCLSDNPNLCPIGPPTANSTYVKCNDGNQPCDYSVPFLGIGRVCTCPTRLEIYARYNI
jgi:hypothetical protein